MRIAGVEFSSRLILGTGGFPRLETLAEAITSSTSVAMPSAWSPPGVR